MESLKNKFELLRLNLGAIKSFKKMIRLNLNYWQHGVMRQPSSLTGRPGLSYGCYIKSWIQ
jgi:hypothetical protein